MQFPDGIDIIVRSLRAGIRFRCQQSVWGCRTDRHGFSIVADEVTYGADFETGDAQSLFPR
jgi:Flp pilus assembly protein TadB